MMIEWTSFKECRCSCMHGKPNEVGVRHFLSVLTRMEISVFAKERSNWDSYSKGQNRKCTAEPWQDVKSVRDVKFAKKLFKYVAN